MTRCMSQLAEKRRVRARSWFDFRCQHCNTEQIDPEPSVCTIYPESIFIQPEDAYKQGNVLVLCRQCAGLLQSNLISPLELREYAAETAPIPNGTLRRTRTEFEDRAYQDRKKYPKKQRKKARERDNHECRCCGLTASEHVDQFGHNINTHHLVPRHEFETEEDFHGLSNLLTVCAHCHNVLEKYFPDLESQVQFCLRNEGTPTRREATLFVENWLGVPADKTIYSRIMDMDGNRQATLGEV